MRVLLAGLATVDVVQRVEGFPEPGHKVQSTSSALAAGGPATNAAVTVAALGGRAWLLTSLGRHPLADLARQDLAGCGVRVLDTAPDHPDPPPVSAITVRAADGERTVVSPNAAANSLPEPNPPAPDPGEPQPAGVDLPEVDLPEVDAVLVDGHHPGLALRAARHAREQGIPVVVDAGSWRPVFTELLPMAYVVACSAQFTAPAGAVDAVPAVIHTAGADPVRWRTRDSAGETSGEVPVPRVPARDTLGAGDVWHGALVSRIGGPDPGPDLPELIEFANAVAAERVRHEGPRSWVGPVRAMMGVT